MRRRITLALSMLVVAAVPAAAQQPQTVAAPTEQSASAVQSTVTPAPAAGLAATPATKQGAAARLDNTQQQHAAVSAATPSVRVAPVRHSVALMVVGGAGLLVGSLVGGSSGNIIMVGSGVIGLYGLYLYLR